MHNMNIKIIVDISHHLELKEDCIEVFRHNTNIYVMASSSKDTPKFKRKFLRKGKKGNYVQNKAKGAHFEKIES